MPGPGWDRRYIVRKSARVWAPQISVPVPRATAMTELAVSRRGRVRAPAGRPSSMQPRVARAGPPVTGLRYSSLVSVLSPGAGPSAAAGPGMPPSTGSGGPGCGVRRACRPGPGWRCRRRFLWSPGRAAAGPVRVVTDETRPQAQHERGVEAVHPYDGLVAAGMDVAVPAPAGREDEVARFHRHAVPVDDHAGSAAREPEPHGGDGMGVDGALSRRGRASGRPPRSSGWPRPLAG